MKRIVCLALALLLCLSLPLAQAEQAQIPQLQKLLLQVVKSSGLRGVVTLNVSGDKPWAQLLSALNDWPLQLRIIDGVSEGFQYKLYWNDENDTETAVTDIFSDGSGTGWIRSDFLLDTLLSFPTETDLLSSLTGLDVDNPTWYFAALRMLLMTEESWTTSWTPQLNEAFLALDSWINSLADSPAVLTQDDGKVMQFRCEISSDQLKQEMKQLVSMLLENEALMTLVGRQVSRAQESAYLNAGYLWYYNQCIDALPLTGNVVLERQMSIQGETLSARMTFPVAGFGTLQQVTLSQQDGATALELVWQEKSLTITAREAADASSTTGEILYTVAEGDGLSASYALASTAQYGVDDSMRDTESYTWELSLAPIPGEADHTYADFAPVQLKAEALLYSKSGDFNPTTLELTAAAAIDECTVSLATKLRTTTQWSLPDAPADEGINLADLTPETRSALLQDWLANGLLAFAARTRVTAVPEATSVPEDAAATQGVTLLTEAPTATPEPINPPNPTEAPEGTEIPAATEAAP